MEALGKIAESGQIVSKKAQRALVEVVSDSSFNSTFREVAIDALGNMVGYLLLEQLLTKIPIF